jgi:GPI-anchor transamidase subunit U
MLPQTQSKLTFFLIVTLGVALRIFLLNKAHLRQWLENRVEISTPLTSWTRVLEGVSLRKMATDGLASSSYQGDLVHEIPVMLRLYEILLYAFTSNYIKYAFVFVDALNGIILCLIVKKVIDYLNAIEALNKSLGRYHQNLTVDTNKQLG